VTAAHQQLAVEHRIHRQDVEQFGKGARDVVAAA
jgi:hypothetical protein